jgi:hypothetical protein
MLRLCFRSCMGFAVVLLPRMEGGLRRWAPHGLQGGLERVHPALLERDEQR